MTVRWNVNEWSAQCGSPPKDETASGGLVTITQQSSELYFQTPSRNYSSLHCYEPLPGLVRRTHSSGRKSWSNLCESASGDPRLASIHTTLTAGDDRIDLAETATYEYRVEGQPCSASSGRRQSFRLLERSSAPPSLVPIEQLGGVYTSTAGPEPRCTHPGAVAKLEVVPDRKLLRPGDTFEFDTTAQDRAGCPTTSPVVWTIAQGLGELDLSKAAAGKIVVSPRSPEGHTILEAKSEGARVLVHLELVSPGRYEALLSTHGTRPTPVATEAEPTASHSIGAPIANAIDFARRRKSLFLALAGAIALMLVMGGSWLLKLGRTLRWRAASPVGDGPIARLKQAYDRMQPYQPAPDGTSSHARPATVGGSEASARQQFDERAPGTQVCPCCGALYSARAQFCGSDGTALVPVN